MTDDRREWYIYVLRDPRNDEVRYVGFTTDVGKRFRVHISEATRGIAKSHKNNWIRSLLNLDLQPVMKVIERGIGEWQSVEMYWIRHYRMQGARLTNSTDGGEGTLGVIVRQETIKKMRDVRTRKYGVSVRRAKDGIIFASLSDAARSVDRRAANIRYALKTGTKCAGHHWERVGETPPADPYTLDGNALVMRID